MNWLRSGKTKVEQHMRYLNLINEVRSLTTPPIRYQEFDLKSEHIRNLVETYESTKTISIKDANNMKWTRITAMFLGVNKDQTRAIDEDFIEEDIVKQLDPNSVEKKFLDTLKKVDIEDGLDGLLGDSQDDREKVDSRLLCIKTISTLIDSEGSISKDLTPELEGIFNAIRRGSEAIINKSKDETYKKSPIRKLEDAREIIEEVVQRFHEVKLAKDFESSAFKYQLKKLRKTLDDLADEVDKS
jgi:hypothetical protein